jgi:branched-chain amino acid aminotransferase
MTEPIAYLNGQFLPQRQAQLALHDGGFVLGATVTDLCRTFNHRLFRWPDHLHRFRQSCALAEISQPIADDDLTAIAQRLVAHNAALLGPGQDLALVVFATPGPIGWYVGEPTGPGEGPPTLGLHTFPLPFARYAHLFTEGARLVIPAVRQVPSVCVDPRIKQRSRLHWWLADRGSRRYLRGASALLLDTQGWVTETSTANFLIVRGGTVLSPPLSSVLEGVSLQVTRELCAELGIPFREEQLSPADCRGADEALLTSTPYGIAGVRSIDEVELRWPGPLLHRLLEGWSRRVGLDIVVQFLAAQ